MSRRKEVPPGAEPRQRAPPVPGSARSAAFGLEVLSSQWVRVGDHRRGALLLGLSERLQAETAIGAGGLFRAGLFEGTQSWPCCCSRSSRTWA
ncbi:MAG TPA: hypothetical protein VGV93_08515 [Acidimicrobiales bacterium]|nr:hypothetical protein [Acidimicrobiales bacterium]